MAEHKTVHTIHGQHTELKSQPPEIQPTVSNVNKKFNGQVVFVSENTGNGTYQVQIYNGGTVTGGTLLTTQNFTDAQFDQYRSYLRTIFSLLT